MPSARLLPIWGWTAPVRGLLIGSTFIGAIWLLSIAPGRDQVSAPMPPLVVDPNTAPPQVLMALPRLGPSLVGRIVEAREIAPFDSIEDLQRRVRGLGPATIKALRPHLHIDPPRLESPIKIGRRNAERPLPTAPTMAHNAR